MRVLLMSPSGLGHVFPMVPLALALRDRGHEVRWLTGPDACRWLRDAGVDADPVGVTIQELRAEYHARYPEALAAAPRAKADHGFPHLFGELLPPHVVPDAVRIGQAWRPDLVVHDAAELAGPIVAAVVGVPNVTHSFGALTPRERVSAAATFVAPMWRSVGLEPRPFCGLYDHLYLDIYPPSLQSADMGHVPRRQGIRPEAIDGRGDDTPMAPGDPADGPLVYVTFGTVLRDRPILRVALEAIAALPVRVLVTVGPLGDPDALGPQPPNVRVERFIAQAQVLPQCAVVVSHSGSGTFLGALAHGVPQLCLPQEADQFLNADAGRAAGVGLAIEPAAATDATIGEAVGRLLDDRSFGERARAAAAEIAAMPDAAGVAADLERLVAST